MVPAVIDIPPVLPDRHVLSSSAEEEGLKRNTDCVYFLASPLTCKKGSECEYRHSETTRLNPRDCWYWINANCLNAKCAFRHPPLDGLLGTQAATSSGPPVSTLQTFTKTATYKPGPGHQIPPAYATYNQGKQTVPCVFFQKGFCGKGSRCTFSHGMSPVTDPLNVKKSHPQENALFLLKAPSTANPGTKSESRITKNRLTTYPDTKSESHVLKNRLATEKSYFEPTLLSVEGSSSMEVIVAPVMNGNDMNWSNHAAQNKVSDDSQDDDEFFRECSPGFDVLVDDDLRDVDCFHGDDHFGRSLNDIDVDASSYYNQVADIGLENFHDHQHGHGSNDPRMQVQNDLKPQHRDSRQRNLVRSDSLERRGYDYLKAENTNQMGHSDLRQRLKQGRVNRFRSDNTHKYPPERSLSSRLGSRIIIPERFSNMYNSDRSSKRRENSTNTRVPEDLINEKRNIRGPRTRRDTIVGERRIDFTGPKSLAELKASKTGCDDQKEQQQMEGGDVSFEGPKPLSEILKRKRGVASLNEGNNHLFNVQENSPKYAKVEPVGRVDGLLSSSNEPYVTEVEVECEGFEDFDYEQQIAGSDYKLDDEGEDIEHEDEYVDGEEADDFAKKMGLMFS